MARWVHASLEKEASYATTTVLLFVAVLTMVLALCAASKRRGHCKPPSEDANTECVDGRKMKSANAINGHLRIKALARVGDLHKQKATARFLQAPNNHHRDHVQPPSLLLSSNNYDNHYHNHSTYQSGFDLYNDDDEMAPSAVWERCILLGEKCEPPSFSGVILYDELGNRVPELPGRSPLRSLGALGANAPPKPTPPSQSLRSLYSANQIIYPSVQQLALSSFSDFSSSQADASSSFATTATAASTSSTSSGSRCSSSLGQLMIASKA